ncbi:hypothetical protein C8R44DRAFT_910767 [Mycena epipterygia]|nr:hypothetical protein C8R44DRAFT_910767 [Mycena epipterygia]
MFVFVTHHNSNALWRRHRLHLACIVRHPARNPRKRACRPGTALRPAGPPEDAVQGRLQIARGCVVPPPAPHPATLRQRVRRPRGCGQPGVLGRGCSWEGIVK